MDNSLLLIHNAGYIFSGVLTLIAGIVVLIKGKDRLVNVLYTLTNLLFSIFVLAYYLGVNTADPDLSKFYLMFTLVNLLTVTVNAHMIWELLGLSVKLKKVIVAFYSMAAALLVFFIIKPEFFLESSHPYLYLQNFFTPGQYYWIFVAFFGIVATFFLGTLVKKWLETSGNEKTRVAYLLIAFMWAYGTGSIAFLPIFGINADPLFSAFVGIHTIILAYAILNYKLLDLHIVAVRAVNFSVFTSMAGLLIVGVNWFNDYAIENVVSFPSWLVPLLSGICVVIVGFITMKKLREADILKYEFINNISHKFRTPLTHIRWMSEELRDEPDLQIRNREVEQIQYATMRLFELTNIVMDVARNSEVESIYNITSFDVREVVKNMIEAHNDQISRKHLVVHINYEPNLPLINADKTRLQFAIQILLENSIVYTPEGGKIDISVRMYHTTNSFVFFIKDSGIGIGRDDIPKLFEKFFRTANARLADTEGMGIGLFMARKIIQRHNGNITVDSGGQDKGTSFTFTIPQQK